MRLERGDGMKKKMIFIILTMMLFIMLFIPAHRALAAGIDTSGIDVSSSTQSEFDTVGKVILGGIQGIGMGVSVITLVVIGIKYMFGSVEEKAEYKSSMIPYIIGVLFLALCTSIPNIVYDFFN